jgi:site-specific DNA-methyltransferase (adenine-specific)
MRIQSFSNGIAINSSFGSSEVQEYLLSLDRFPLIVADPPYNILNEKWDKYTEDSLCSGLISWSKCAQDLLIQGGSLYMWGGIGKYKSRAFFKYLSIVEHETSLQMRNLITWKKVRGFGKKDDYLFTREECGWFIAHQEKPAIFNIPLLETKRGYPGFNKKYPAKSEYYRRSNCWTDITEILRGKQHVAHKPEKLAEIMISTHTNEGMTVLDPFAGSGSTAVAAAALNRRFVVIEKDTEIFDKMCARLMSLKA